MAEVTGAPARGVTLLELMIVLMLMALIAGLVIPTVGGSGVSTTELKSAARELAAGLRLARDRAIAKRTEATLELNVETHSFRVPPDLRDHTLPQRIELKLYTAQRDVVSDKVGAIRFFPDGGSNGGRITLAAGDRKYDVDVDWLTGRVTIVD